MLSLKQIEAESANNGEEAIKKVKAKPNQKDNCSCYQK
jgi:hypothetical protein